MSKCKCILYDSGYTLFFYNSVTNSLPDGHEFFIRWDVSALKGLKMLIIDIFRAIFYRHI